MILDPASTVEQRQAAAASLRTFMRLPVVQRSSVILMDVLGYTLQEICEVMNLTMPAVKAALNRGRARLRELAREPDDLPPPVDATATFTSGRLCRSLQCPPDFDRIRDLLADEVRLEVVSRTRLNGKSEVGKYFGNYSLAQDWQLVTGFVDRRPAALVRDPGDPSGLPTYFVLLEWAGDRLVSIRDFRHARYVAQGAELPTLD